MICHQTKGFQVVQGIYCDAWLWRYSLKIILVAYVLPEIVTHKLRDESESDKERILPVSKWKFWTHDSM